MPGGTACGSGPSRCHSPCPRRPFTSPRRLRSGVSRRIAPDFPLAGHGRMGSPDRCRLLCAIAPHRHGRQAPLPDLAKTDTLTPLIMTKLMPIWVYVIVGIGLLAAMNSTAAGYMITSGVIVSQDIYKDQFRPQESDRNRVGLQDHHPCRRALRLLDLPVLEGTPGPHGEPGDCLRHQLSPSLFGILYWRRATAKGAMFGTPWG